MLKAITITDNEADVLYNLVNEINKNWQTKQQHLIQSINLRIGHLKQKLSRATDTLLEGIISKEQYQAQEQKILAKERELLEQQNEVSSEKSRFLQKMNDFFELAKNLEKLMFFIGVGDAPVENHCKTIEKPLKTIAKRLKMIEKNIENH